MSIKTELPHLALEVDGKWFLDDKQRVCMLRGVNLSGGCKMPTGQTSHSPHLFFNHRQVSFTGRPFPLGDEMDQHLERLKSWGFLFLRFQITWEALEHAGPRQYDQEYIDYLIVVLRRARQYGFRCFIDPHQDVWSRFTGGSGAPGWTLEMVGFDLTKFNETDAALVHNTYGDPENFPRMIWPTNYYKLASATMFTLFFGGNVFAPKSLVHIHENDPLQDAMLTLTDVEFAAYQRGEFRIPRKKLVSIQDYLQGRYFDALNALITCIKADPTGLLDSVVCGYDTLNEPSGGYLGYPDISQLSPHQELRNGITPTALQSMLLGEGVTCEVESWDFTWMGPKKSSTIKVNVDNVRCWRDGYQCIWLAHNLYSKSGSGATKMDYFYRHPSSGKLVDWIADFWKPFVRKFTASVRTVHENAIIFVEPPVNESPPLWDADEGDSTDRICYTPHWYDGVTLMNKHFSTWWTIDYIGYKRGRYATILGALSFCMKGIRRNFTKQIGFIRDEGLAYIGDTPCLIGEIGIPYDMDDKASFKPNATDKYESQIKAMDTNIVALEANMLNFTLWNYVPDNTHKHGDKWNGEDLSLWSADDCSLSPKRTAPNMRSVAQKGTDLDAPPTHHRNRLVQRTVATTAIRPQFSDDADSGVGSSNLGKTKTSNDSIALEEDLINNTGHSRSKTSPDAEMHSSLAKKRLSVVRLANGARALEAFLRPYPMYTCGHPVHLSFDTYSKSKKFHLVYRNSTRECAAELGQGTEIFLPQLHYGSPIRSITEDEIQQLYSSTKDTAAKYFDVAVLSGSWEYEANTQILHCYHGNTTGVSKGVLKAAGVEVVEYCAGLHLVSVTVLSRRQVLDRVSRQSNCIIC